VIKMPWCERCGRPIHGPNLLCRECDILCRTGREMNPASFSRRTDYRGCLKCGWSKYYIASDGKKYCDDCGMPWNKKEYEELKARMEPNPVTQTRDIVTRERCDDGRLHLIHRKLKIDQDIQAWQRKEIIKMISEYMEGFLLDVSDDFFLREIEKLMGKDFMEMLHEKYRNI